MLGTDHKSLLLARIFDGKSRQTKVDTSHMPEAVKEAVDRQLATFALRYQKALVVSIGDILKAADNSETKTKEIITVGEQPLLEELPSDHLYQSHKPQSQQQVATLIAANAPPSVRTHVQQRRLIGLRNCQEVLKKQ